MTISFETYAIFIHTKGIESFQTLEAKKIAENQFMFHFIQGIQFCHVKFRWQVQPSITRHEFNHKGAMVVKIQHKSSIWYQDRQITKSFQLTNSRKPKEDLECPILYQVINMQYNTSWWHSFYVK